MASSVTGSDIEFFVELGGKAGKYNPVSFLQRRLNSTCEYYGAGCFVTSIKVHAYYRGKVAIDKHLIEREYSLPRNLVFQELSCALNNALALSLLISGFYLLSDGVEDYRGARIMEELGYTSHTVEALPELIGGSTALLLSVAWAIVTAVQYKGLCCMHWGSERKQFVHQIKDDLLPSAIQIATERVQGSGPV